MYKSKIAIAILMLVFLAQPVIASPDHHREHQKYDRYDRHNPYDKHKGDAYRDRHTYDRHANDHRHQNLYARVIRVKPIYETIRIKKPGRHCETRGHRHSDVTVIHQHSPEKVIMGGIIGGIVGHEFGNPYNRELSTLAGVVIGSTLAHNATSADYVVRDDRDHYYNDCRRHMRVIEKQKLVGYKVKYKFRGRIYSTRTSYHPGKRIAVHPGHGPRRDY